MWTFMIQGWRNLRRNIRRTTITVAVVAVGLSLLILSYGLVKGFIPQMIEGGARTLNGHILIHARGYFQKKALDLLIQKPERVLRALQKDQRVEAWSRRLIARGLLGSAEGVRGVKLLGVEPEKDKEIINLYSRIIKGRAPRPVPPKARLSRRTVEVLIGKKIANKLKVEVGSKVVLKIGVIGGGATNIPMRVSGIFAIGSPGFDGLYIVTHLQDAASFLNAKGAIHQFALRVKKLKDVKAVTKSLRQQLALQNSPSSHPTSSRSPNSGKPSPRSVTTTAPTNTHRSASPNSGKPSTQAVTTTAPTTSSKKQPAGPVPLEILPWWETSPEIKAMVDMSDYSIGIMLLFIFPIVLLGCLNTMLMSAYERTREIGVIKALGTRPGQILQIFFFEALFIGLVGSLIGIVLGGGLNLYLESIGGLTLDPFMSDDVKMLVSGVALEPVMWVKTTVGVVVIPSISVILSTVIAALYPAWKASRLQPAQAILFH